MKSKDLKKIVGDIVFTHFNHTKGIKPLNDETILQIYQKLLAREDLRRQFKTLVTFKDWLQLNWCDLGTEEKKESEPVNFEIIRPRPTNGMPRFW